MTNIIDFIARHEQKELTKRQRAVEGSYFRIEQLQQLVDNQQLQVKDHALFLSFLFYLQERKINALSMFKDVFALPRTQFEQQYQMKWWAVVQLGFTFLAILKKNEPAQYLRFYELANKEK